MKRIAALVLLALSALPARTHELTVDLANLFPGGVPSAAVRLFSQSLGGGGLLNDASVGFGGYRTLRPVTGTAVVDIPASADFDRPQQYLLTVGSTRFVFEMPAAAASLSVLVAAAASAGEPGPCVVSATAPPSPAQGDLWCHTDGTTLSYRAGSLWHAVTGGDGNTGLTASQVDARIKDYARTSGRAIALGDLLEVDRDKIEDAIISLTFDSTSRQLTITTNEPVTSTLLIPGVTAEDEGTLLGNVDQIDCRGAGIACTRLGNELTVTVAGGTTGGGTPYDDGPLTARVVGVEAFEGALRRVRSLGGVSITEGLSNAFVMSGLRLPLAAQDRMVRVTVDSEDPDTFPLADLLSKTPVSTPGTQASSGNSVSITSDDGDVLSFALSIDGDLWIADDTVASRHSFAVAVDEIDLKDAARASSAVSLVGPAGPTGPAGPQGPKGDPGSGASLTVEGTADSIEATTAGGTVTLSPQGKLKDWLDAVDSSGWQAANGPADSTPFLAGPFGSEPVEGDINGATFAISQTGAGPTVTPAWFVVRMPRSLGYHGTRYRLLQETSLDEDNVPYRINVDDHEAGPSPTVYAYYVVQVVGFPAGETARVQVFDEFGLKKGYFDLTSDELSDMPTAEAKAAARNVGKAPTLQSDGDYELEFPGPVPSTTLPPRLVDGERYALSAAYTFRHWYEVTPAASGTNDPARAAAAQGMPDGWTLVRYSNALTLDSQIRGQLVLTRPSTETRNPQRLWIDDEEFILSGALSGAYIQSFVVQSPPPFQAGTKYDVILQFTSNELDNLPPAARVPVGDYTATGEQTWVGTPGRQADWATIGNTDLIPPGKVPHVAGRDFIAHSFRMSLNRTDQQARWGAPYYFAPVIDLDDADNQRGEFNHSLRLTVAPTSDNQMSFVEGKVNPGAVDRTIIVGNEVHLHTLRGRPDYVATNSGAPTGAETWAQVDVWSGTTRVGTFYAADVHNSDNEAAVFVWYVGAAGATGAVLTGTIYGHRTTGDIGSAGSFVGLSDTPASLAGQGGKVLEVNPGGTALILADKEGGADPVEAVFTPSSTRTSWGSLGSSSSPRSIAASAPQTITLTGSGDLPAGIALSSSVVTLQDAGRVTVAGTVQIEAWNTASDAATNGNNSRSEVECWIERAPSGSSTFAELARSRSETAYLRVAKPYWNHGRGEGRVRPGLDYAAAAGDQLRLRCEATYRQASTVQHAVIGGALAVIHG